MSLSTNIAAWWKLEEAAGSARFDSSPNGRNLLLSGTVGQTTGLHGNAANFDATGFLVRTASAIVSSGAQSFAAWIRPTSLAAGTQALYSQALTTTTKHSVLLTADGTIAWGGVVGSLTLTESEWGHVAVTYNGTNAVEIYVNGALDPSSGAGTITYTVNRGCLGGQADATALYIGAMDSAGVWSKQLTAEEITALYLAGEGMDYPFGLILTRHDPTDWFQLLPYFGDGN